MNKIGGNIIAQLQVKNGTIKNEIGEKVPQWETAHNLRGWLDLSNGDSKYMTYDAKIQESTHIFICDYQMLSSTIKAENSRMIINNQKYDIMLIDNPMGLNYQLEFYLKFTGGQ